MVAKRLGWLVVVGAGVMLVACGVGGGVPAGGGRAGVAAAAAASSQASGMYYLAMGDSLAYGYRASAPSKDYVNLIAQHEQTRFPGLQVENLGCPGATAGNVLDGGTSCSYSTGTQEGDAEAFLKTHPGQIAFVTIDIGANNVDGCVPNGKVNLTCVEKGFGDVQSQLPQILAGLQQADPGVTVFGMNYYDPFLADWLTGGGGQQVALLSVSLADTFNHDLDQIYGAAGYPTADVADAFATDDTALTGSYDGQTVPQDVADICTWTYMCSTATIHTNDTGYALLARAFEQQIDGWFDGGGPGAVLASSGGEIYALGNALYYGGPAVGLRCSSGKASRLVCGLLPSSWQSTKSISRPPGSSLVELARSNRAL